MKNIKDDKREQRRIEKLLKKIGKHMHMAVGILQDKPHDEHFSMVELAMVHEYGTDDKRIPARSFIRSTCDALLKEHLKLISKLQWKVFLGRLTEKQALAQLGEVVASDIKEAINDGLEPDLADSTIAAKKNKLKKKPTGEGFKPLIETGVLKGSITHEIRGGA